MSIFWLKCKYNIQVGKMENECLTLKVFLSDNLLFTLNAASKCFI